MRCPSETPEGAELLLAFSSRELDPERTAAMGNHAANCAACSRLVVAQRLVDDAMDLWDAPAVSADFDRRLYRRIEQEVPWWEFLVRPLRPAFSARFLPVAAAAGLLVAAGIWIQRPAEAPAAPSSARIEALPPDQAENALQEMQTIQEFSNLVHADSADPRM
jgi:anti-sigma factor RsiW